LSPGAFPIVIIWARTHDYTCTTSDVNE